ncbi:hypothetical protein MXD61_22850 [Frankia sp. AgPm24]|nr:type II toxin-antitoxin system HicA family toxin [Frankia sp. AgPm24]MCK9924667.1 hypothetical protein [Frankia sp. AgPm24]
MTKNAEGRFTVFPVHPGHDIPIGTPRRISGSYEQAGQ